jgi:ribosomal protein S18 acetylase RimI-like enzyme
MVVRRLTLQDAEVGAHAIERLKSSDGYPVPPLSHLSDFLSRGENVLIVASEGESPVGYAVAYLLDRIDRDQCMVLLYDIGVAEFARRQGVGTRLMAALKTVCTEEGVMKMWVVTSPSNAAAMRLYTTTGGLLQSNESTVIFEYFEQNLGDAAIDND